MNIMQRVARLRLVAGLFLAVSVSAAKSAELRCPDSVALGETFVAEVVGLPAGARIEWTWERARLSQSVNLGAQADFKATVVGAGFVRASAPSTGWSAVQQITITRSNTGRRPPPTGQGGPDQPADPKIAAAMELMDKFKAGTIDASGFFIGMKSRELAIRDMIAFKAYVIEQQRQKLIDQGVNSQEAIRRSEEHWRAEYSQHEQNLMAARQKGVNEAWSRALGRYAEAHPELPYLGAKMDVGGWASEAKGAMRFEGDIDFSIIMVDVEDALELRRMFEEEIRRAYDLNMVEIDALATAHRAATSDVYIGNYGAKWAEIDAIRRGKMYKLKNVNGKVVPVEMTMDEKIVMLAVLENNEYKRRNGEDILDKILGDDAGPRADMEPGVSLEFLRHVQHDVLHARLSITETIIKTAKYVNRSCTDHARMLAGVPGFTMTAKDSALAHAVETITNVKQDKGMTADAKLARIMNVMKALFGSGWADDPSKALAELGKRSVDLLQHNIDEGCKARLLLAEKAGTAAESDAAKKKLLEDLQNEMKAFEESGIPFPEGAKQTALKLADYFSKKGSKLPAHEQERLKEFMEKVAAQKPDCARITLASVYQEAMRLYGKADKAIDAVNGYLDVLDNNTIQKLRDSRIIEIDVGGGYKISPASINAALNESILGKIGNNTAFKGFNMAQEGLSYYRAIASGETWSDSAVNLSTEIFRRRVPLGGAVDAYFQENYFRVGVEVVYAIFPPLAIPEGLCGMVSGAAEWGMGVLEGWKYDEMVDALYAGAVFTGTNGSWRLESVKYNCPGRGGGMIELQRDQLHTMPDKCAYIWQRLAPQFRNHGVIQQFEKMLGSSAVSGGALTSAGWPYEYLYLNEKTGKYIHQQYKAKVAALAREYFMKLIGELEKRKEWDSGTGFSKADALVKELGCDAGVGRRTGNLDADKVVFQKLLKDATDIKQANQLIAILKNAWTAEFLEPFHPPCTVSGFSDTAKKANERSDALKAALTKAREDVEYIVGVAGCTRENLQPATRARLGMASCAEGSPPYLEWRARYLAALADLRGKGTPLVITLAAPATGYVGRVVHFAASFDREVRNATSAWAFVGSPAGTFDSTTVTEAKWTPDADGTYRVRIRVATAAQPVPSVKSAEIRILPASAMPRLRVGIRAPVTELAEDELVPVTAVPLELGPDRQPFVRYFWFEDGRQTKATAEPVYEFSGAGKLGKEIPLSVLARNAANENTPEDGVLMKVNKPASPNLSVHIDGAVAEMKETDELALTAAVARKRDSGRIELQWVVDGDPKSNGSALNLRGTAYAGKTIKVTLYAKDEKNRDGHAEASIKVKAEGDVPVELSYVPSVIPENSNLVVLVTSPVGSDYKYKWVEWTGSRWGSPVGYLPTLSYSCRGQLGHVLKFRAEVTDKAGRTGAAETREILVTNEVVGLKVTVEPESATAMPGDKVQFTARVILFPDSGALKVNGTRMPAGTESMSFDVTVDPGSPPILSVPVEIEDEVGRTGEAVFTVYVKDKPAAGSVSITGATTAKPGEKVALRAHANVPAGAPPTFAWTGATGQGDAAEFKQDRIGDYEVKVSASRGGTSLGAATHRISVKAGEPSVKITAPANGTETPETTIVIAGEVTGFEEVAKMEMSVNGAAYQMPASAAFSQKMPIVPGDNTIQVSATLKDGRVVHSAVVTVKSTQSAANRYRFTLRWDTAKTDIDLWLVGPSGTACSYNNMHTSFAELDKDVINEGYGPENIFIANLTEYGTYKVRVNYYGNHNEGDAPATGAEVLFFTDNKLTKSWKGSLGGVGSWWDVYSFTYGMTVQIKTPAKTRVNIGETLKLFGEIKAVSEGLGEMLKGGQTFRWVADGGAEFSPVDTIKPETTALFTRPGTTAIRVQVMVKQGNEFKVVGESDPVSIEVIGPTYTMKFEPPQPMVGQEVLATVVPDRPVDKASLDFRWEVSGPVLRHGPAAANDVWHYTAIGMKAEPVTLTARGRTPFHGDSAGTATGSFTPKLYTVKVVSLGGAYAGSSRPRIFDPVRMTFVDAPAEAVMADQMIRLRATLEGEPMPAEVRWKWTVNEGTTLGNDISQEPSVSRHEAGTINATVEARDKENVVLGTGTIAIPVSADPTTSQPLTLTVKADKPTIRSGESTYVRVEAKGGKPPYTFTWSGAATAQGETVQARGERAGTLTFNVAAKDSGTKTASGNASVVVEPVTLTVNVNASARNVTVGTPMALNVSVSGGTAPYTFVWSAPASGSAQSATFTPDAAGSATAECTATDKFGNKGVGRVVIAVAELHAEIQGLPAEIVFGSTASATISGVPNPGFRAQYTVPAGVAITPNPAPGGRATVTFRKMGEVSIDAEIQMQIGSTWKTIGRTAPRDVRVTGPQLTMQFAPEEGRPGDTIRATVRTTPAIASTEVGASWTGAQVEIGPALAAQFVPASTSSVEIVATVKARASGEVIGTVRRVFTPRPVDVIVRVTGAAGPRAQTWDDATKQVVNLPAGKYAEQEQVYLEASTRDGSSAAKYEWSAKDGAFDGPTTERKVKAYGTKKGSTAVFTVTAKNAAGQAMGAGSASLSIVQTQQDSTDAANKAADADKAGRANAIEAEGDALAAASKLNEALGKYQAANQIIQTPQRDAKIADVKRRMTLTNGNSTTAGATNAAAGKFFVVDLTPCGGKKGTASMLNNILVDAGSWLRLKHHGQDGYAPPKMQMTVPVPSVAGATSVAVDGNLDHAHLVPQGTTITRMTVLSPAGNVTFDIKAGVHMSEWNGPIKHQHAPTAAGGNYLPVFNLPSPRTVMGLQFDYVELPKEMDHGSDAPGFCLRGITLVLNGATGGPTPNVSPMPQVQSTGNTGSVQNGPTAPTTFTFGDYYVLTSIMTYHWNYGRGTTAPGTIGLRHSDGSMFGPWRARGTPGQGGVPNANWIADVTTTLKPGTYTVVDSDPATWAQNAQSGGRGHAEIKGHPARTTPVAPPVVTNRPVVTSAPPVRVTPPPPVRVTPTPSGNVPAPSAFNGRWIGRDKEGATIRLNIQHDGTRFGGTVEMTMVINGKSHSESSPFEGRYRNGLLTIGSDNDPDNTGRASLSADGQSMTITSPDGESVVFRREGATATQPSNVQTPTPPAVTVAGADISGTWTVMSSYDIRIARSGSGYSATLVTVTKGLSDIGFRAGEEVLRLRPVSAHVFKGERLQKDSKGNGSWTACALGIDGNELYMGEPTESDPSNGMPYARKK